MKNQLMKCGCVDAAEHESMIAAEILANKGRVLAVHPEARVFCGGDGYHIEVEGKWFAYGNIESNAWKAAAYRLSGSALYKSS